MRRRGLAGGIQVARVLGESGVQPGTGPGPHLGPAWSRLPQDGLGPGWRRGSAPGVQACRAWGSPRRLWAHSGRAAAPLVGASPLVQGSGTDKGRVTIARAAHRSLGCVAGAGLSSSADVAPTGGGLHQKAQPFPSHHCTWALPVPAAWTPEAA